MKATVTGTDEMIALINKKAKQAQQISKEEFGAKVISALKDATPVDTGEARNGWKLSPAGDVINEVDHIASLNGGSSKQAPSHFIEKTVMSMPRVTSNGVIVVYTK